MNHYEILIEDLFEGDLADMVTPVISFDEFESKIDENVIVLAFHVKNDKAAEDLAIFIERSSIANILDTEVSSAPDKLGNYLVFVEVDFKNDQLVSESILKLIKIINNLVGSEQTWYITNNRFLMNKRLKLTSQSINAMLNRINKERG